MKRVTFTFFVGPSVFIMLALMTLPLLASILLGMHFITFRNLDEPDMGRPAEIMKKSWATPEVLGLAGVYSAIHLGCGPHTYRAWLDFRPATGSD